MKHWLVGVAILSGILFASGQGNSVNFANLASGAGGNVNAPLVGADSSYMAQLYAGPALAAAALLTTNGVSGGPAQFLSGAQTGYFIGGIRTISGFIAGQSVSLQVRAWNSNTGDSWESATLRAESNVVQITLGNTPGVTPNLVGLAFAPIPEPHSITVGALGLAALACMQIQRKTARR